MKPTKLNIGLAAMCTAKGGTWFDHITEFMDRRVGMHYQYMSIGHVVVDEGQTCMAYIFAPRDNAGKLRLRWHVEVRAVNVYHQLVTLRMVHARD